MNDKNVIQNYKIENTTDFYYFIKYSEIPLAEKIKFFNRKFYGRIKDRGGSKEEKE